jgi:hypothetical protein
MHIHTLDFETRGEDLGHLNDPWHNNESTQGAMVPPSKGGAHVPIWLRGGL